MKFNTLRHLILPWFLLFCAIIAAIIIEGTILPVDTIYHPYLIYLLGVGIFFSLLSNFKTLTKAGIWIANGLPSNLSRRPFWWVSRAIIAIGLAYLIFEVGKMSWVPVIWQAAVIPLFFTICLFAAIWNLMGPVLSFCSRVSFSRISAFILSWPVFALVPITAVFLGNTVLIAYKESRPDFAFVTAALLPEESAPAKEAVDEDEVIPATNKFAVELQEAVQSGKSCQDKLKLIQASLLPTGDADVIYWSVRAVKCTEMKAVIGLPKLADIMMKNTNAIIRAAAIRGMMQFGVENVKRITYLLVKRISDSEPTQVIEAAATVMLRLGEDERAMVSKRLTALLDNPKTSAVASKLLVSKLKREDLVSEFVAKNLTETSHDRNRAISMLCSLPEASRKTAEPHIDVIVGSIKSGEHSDPAVKALECLGQPGLEALRKEIATPTKLTKTVAARAFAEGSWKDEAAVLETSSACVHDSDEEVRNWCSQALGKVGAAAVPRILELLTSTDSQKKNTATNALRFFKDPKAKEELLKVRASNSGWWASQKNLEVARSIDKALVNMNQPANRN